MTRALLALTFAGVAAIAQPPQFVNGKIETRQSAGLSNAVRGVSGTAWVGYAVPILPGDRQMCGWDGGHPARRLSLEGPSTMFVLVRVEQGQVGKIRTATPDCEIDAGGLTLIRLAGVTPSESVAYLATFIGQDRLGDAAMTGIAFHKDPAAGRFFESVLDSNPSDKVREKAVMWLSIGQHNYDRVIRAAHEDKSPRVRGQALFWLAQGAQKKVAADTISGAIANDPETEVKKKAVFALTQIPGGDGVPKLIEVARTNRNPEVRKQAIFWLGQSKDQRALEFIEQVLTR